MQKLAAVILGFSMIVGLSGCKTDRDDRSYVEIGDARVYDTPSEITDNRRSLNNSESVPAPLALPELVKKHERTGAKVTRSRSYVTIGDVEPD